MNPLSTAVEDERILVLMPTTKDNRRTCDVLTRAQISCYICRDLDDLCQQIAEGGGAALLSEEAIAGGRLEQLYLVVQQQPAWSDFPLIILAREATEERESSFRQSMNVTLVERPVRMRSLISVIRASLRSRRHQYAVRRHLAERDRQAKVLRENDERLRFALAAGKLGSWDLDVASNDLSCSELFKSNFGRTPDAGFSSADLDESIHPADRERVCEASTRALRDRSDYDVEYRIIWPDGSLHWVLVRGRVSGGVDGVPLRMSGVSLDVTAQKEAEIELRDADRRKDEFLALLAHELRNPLAPLRNGVQVMRLSVDDPKTFAEAGAVMERQLGHMVRLIDDLLDISRISQNKMELRKTRVLLADVVAEAVETARPLIKAAGHELTIALPAEPVYLDADLTRLAQVFSNLLSNSVKYTTHRGHIWLTAEQSGQEVAVSVQDDGIGIPTNSLASIFDMFSQVDRTIERSTGGLGIGLALVKGLVEMHGGTVTAESDGPDAGSKFTVRLAMIKPPEPVKPPAQDGRSTRIRRKILVVDDNRDSATTMAMMLKLLGNEVSIAHDGIEAVEAAERFLPEVILMDIGMPRMNGYDATRLIRQQPAGREMLIIALTGWGQDADRQHSQEVGCNGHLVKPVSPIDLNRLMDELGANRTAGRVATALQDGDAER